MVVLVVREVGEEEEEVLGVYCLLRDEHKDEARERTPVLYGEGGIYMSIYEGIAYKG